jgi:phosphoglycolate phosphatase-like HAD superfamily hydrolase
MALLDSAQVLFWDFDGVIKESVSIKEEAFVQLFRQGGPELSARIREHHLEHGGLSRFKKIPLYVQWSGQEVTPERTQELCDFFGALVVKQVIDCPWVPGARERLRHSASAQRMVLVTATPQDEIVQILDALDVRKCFQEIHGAPESKIDSIGGYLSRHGVSPATCVMIGDSLADRDAAHAHGVPFLLRRHDANAAAFSDYTGPSVRDFTQQ